jgi:hypothetical protein
MEYTNSRGIPYHLYGKSVALKNKKSSFIYFFARAETADVKGDPIKELPEGKIIKENPRTGLPVLANAKK